MVDDAMLAFEEGRPDLARGAVMDRDDDIDARLPRLRGGPARSHESPTWRRIERLVQVRFAAKCLERIADHATNLAEQAIFVVSGDDVRHRQTRR
jgi:phosphate transport system protein